MVDNSVQVCTVEIAEVIQNNRSRFKSIPLCRLISFVQPLKDHKNDLIWPTLTHGLSHYTISENGNLCFCCSFIFLVNTCQKRIPMHLLFEFFSLGFHDHSRSAASTKTAGCSGKFQVERITSKPKFLAFFPWKALCATA